MFGKRRGDVEVLGERQVAQERGDEPDVRPPQDGERRPRSASGENHARSGTASAADTNAPGWSPWAANSNASASSSVATTPPIIARITSASRLNVRRRGLVTSRRKNAQPIDTRTMTATTFCIALISVQSRPSNGIDRTCSMIPPVTTFAVPIVSSTKPQKIPACISPARASLNILVWMNA